jgi:predicted RNA-binding protein with TRAM domain
VAAEAGAMVAVVAETTTEVVKPKPVEAGKEYEVDITEISRQGDWIARVQGFVVFVKNGRVGNKVKVKVTEVADRFSKAIIAG